MVEGKAVNASQAFNYCKLMVMICKEAMAGNHYLRSCTYQKKKKKRSCKPPVCNRTQFVDCREWQVLISM